MLCQKSLFVSQINLLYKQEKLAYYYTGTQYITISSFSTSTTGIRHSHFSCQQAEKQTCPTVKTEVQVQKIKKKIYFATLSLQIKKYVLTLHRYKDC